jgi:hypothetical protein
LIELFFFSFECPLLLHLLLLLFLLPCLFCSLCVCVCVCVGFCVVVGVFVLCGGDRGLSCLWWFGLNLMRVIFVLIFLGACVFLALMMPVFVLSLSLSLPLFMCVC